MVLYTILGRKRIVTVAVVLLLIGAYASVPQAESLMMGTSKYGAMTDCSDAGGFPDCVPGDTITGSGATNDMTVVKAKFVWHRPDTTVAETDFDFSSTPGGGADCLTNATKYTGSITNADVNDAVNFICFSDESPIVDVEGDWGMQVFFCDAQDVCTPPEFVAIRAISFFVLPESPLGAVALIGSSMAALGAFMVLRKSRAKPQL